MKKQLKAYHQQATGVKEYREVAETVRKGFRLSAEYIKTLNIIPEEKHPILDDMVETIVNGRGAGWFSEQAYTLIITTFDEASIKGYIASWGRFYAEIKRGANQ